MSSPSNNKRSRSSSKSSSSQDSTKHTSKKQKQNSPENNELTQMSVYDKPEIEIGDIFTSQSPQGSQSSSPLMIEQSQNTVSFNDVQNQIQSYVETKYTKLYDVIESLELNDYNTAITNVFENYKNGFTTVKNFLVDKSKDTKQNIQAIHNFLVQNSSNVTSTFRKAEESVEHIVNFITSKRDAKGLQREMEIYLILYIESITRIRIDAMEEKDYDTIIDLLNDDQKAKIIYMIKEMYYLFHFTRLGKTAVSDTLTESSSDAIKELQKQINNDSFNQQYSSLVKKLDDWNNAIIFIKQLFNDALDDTDKDPEKRGNDSKYFYTGETYNASTFYEKVSLAPYVDSLLSIIRQLDFYMEHKFTSGNSLNKYKTTLNNILKNMEQYIEYADNDFKHTSYQGDKENIIKSKKAQFKLMITNLIENIDSKDKKTIQDYLKNYFKNGKLNYNINFDDILPVSGGAKKTRKRKPRNNGKSRKNKKH